jgi:hypothetical protein
VTSGGNDQPTDTADGACGQRAAIERALMDRARAHALHVPERPPRLLRNTVGFAVALLLVAVVLLGLDAFLTAMQKFMETKVVDPAPAPTAPMPAYAVPTDVSPPLPADQGPRPSPGPAPDTSQATP